MERRRRQLFDASRCLGGHEMASIEELLARSVRRRFSGPETTPSPNSGAASSRAKQMQEAGSQMKLEVGATTSTTPEVTVPEAATGVYLQEGMSSPHIPRKWDAHIFPCIA